MGWAIALGILVLLLTLVVRVTKVEEGTAKALMTFGQFSKIIFRWEGKWMDAEWNIWRPGEEESKGKERSRVWDQRVFGGLTVYFWPFQKIHRYKHRWTDIRLRQARMEVEFHEEELDHVLLKAAVYAFKLTAVETRPPQRIPVDIVVLVTLRVRNPYRFLFIAPPTPLEDILARISAETRVLVTSCRIDELLQLKGVSLWGALKDVKVIEDTLDKWGVVLAKEGIEIRDIDIPPEYEKVLTAEERSELEAKAERRKALVEAEGRAAALVDTLIWGVSKAGGKTKKQVQEVFWKDPESFIKKHHDIWQGVISKLAMEERAYLRIETPGATGALGDLLRLIGTWRRMPTGRARPTREREVPRRLSDEEYKRAIRRAVEEVTREKE